MSFPAEGDHQHHHRIPVAQEGELYSLKWHTFQSHLTSGLKQFLFDGDFLTDVTLVAEGKMIRSHRMLLSLCSPHFKQLFQGNSAQNVNTIVILNNVRYQDLQHVIQFIYNGEVKVSNNYELQGFLQTGELLQIEGLTKTSSKHETEGREPASQQQQGHLSPNAQSTPIPQMHHRRSHIQVPNKGGPGPARSHQIPVTSAGDGSSHPPPTKRTRLLPTATVTSATVAYGEANNVVSSITGDLNSSSLEDGGDGVSGIDPLAVPDLSSIAAMVEHDPLNLMNETGVSQHQHQHGVPGIDDEEQMITIDSIKSESGVEGLYDERDEEEDEEGFEMTDHGDASGLGVDGMYDVKSSGPGPSSAISGGASVGGGANVKPPGVNRRKQVIRRIRAILGKDGPSDKISKSASSVKRHAEVASLCSSNMSKFKFPYPKRGIGRVDLDEESVTSVWTFFQYNPISDRSQCNFCGYMLAGKNCTNLRVHLKSRHADLFEFDLTSGQVYGP
ncbi:broad-complex core protein isoforms 1/2/3/4/5 isoform X3 [Folsomia candida]|uniref:broad-complex core protein isoforms 1/2/3/4/5 isoform X3 n=1 Tax=Folsomia candida TaxID=158441 RepID=UPI000B8FE885|nr:broad-complex core protein isoforms 1/2/3/4/5 isoform X3 [Folsomia candida]